MAVFIKLKPKGGRGQFFRTCRSFLDHEQSGRRLDRLRRRRGWHSESLCCSQHVPCPAALQAPPSAASAAARRRHRAPLPATPAEAAPLQL